MIRSIILHLCVSNMCTYIPVTVKYCLVLKYMTTIVAYCEFLSSGGSINLQGYLGCNKLLMLAGFYASRFAIVK